MRGYSGRRFWRRNNWKVIFGRFEFPNDASHTEETRIYDRASKIGQLFLTSALEKHVPFSLKSVLPYYIHGTPKPMPAGYATCDIGQPTERKTGAVDWYKMVAYIFGITVALISLTSLQIVNIMKKISFSPSTEQTKWTGNCAENDPPAPPSSSSSSSAVKSEQPLRRRQCPDTVTFSGTLARNWIASRTQSQVLDGCDCPSCSKALADNSCDMMEACPDPPPPEEGSSPSLHVWPNCLHFTSGLYQICLLCWLKSPQIWLFGPSLSCRPSDPCSTHCGSQCTCELAETPGPAGLAGLTSVLATGEPSSTPHFYHRANLAGIGPASGVSLLKRRQVGPLDRPASEALPKYPRSSGDGAPSSSLIDVDVGNRARSKDSPIAGNVSMLQAIPRPLFYTADSDSDSSTPLLHHWVTCEPDSGPTSGSEQLRISVSKLAAKATALLQSAGCRRTLTRVTSELMHRSSERCPAAAAGGPGGYKVKETDNSGLHSGLCPTYDYSTETLEYDDFLPTLGSRQSLTNSEASDAQSTELTEADEAMLLNLLDTLNSLMHLKHGTSPPRRQTSQPSIDTGGGAGRTPVKNYSFCEAVNASFSDLSKRATELTEDLATLEEILDHLHYKVCANEIELANVEDNLATAWHLHDNLDSTDESAAASLVCSVCEDSRSSSPESCRRVSRTDSQPVTTPPPPQPQTEAQSQPTPDLSLPLDQRRTSGRNSPESPVDCKLKGYFRDATAAIGSSQTTVSTMTKSVTESTPLSKFASTSTLPPLMTTSAPDGRLDNFAGASSTVSRGLSAYRSRKTRSSRCRLHCHRSSARDMAQIRRSEDLSCLYYSRVDADGFLHPELTFEKDGLVDWETVVSSEKLEDVATVPRSAGTPCSSMNADSSSFR